MYIYSTKSKSAESQKAYKEYKRILNKLLRQTERNHYDELLKENKSNLKKVLGYD